MELSVTALINPAVNLTKQRANTKTDLQKPAVAGSLDFVIVKATLGPLCDRQERRPHRWVRNAHL